ncbi:unnamed protein product, partial [Mesorhabditis spiculigera]
MLELCLLGLYIQRAWRQFAKNKRQLDSYVTKQWEIEPAFLVIKQKIGRGAFANVHHGTYYGPLPCILTNTDLQDRFPVDRKDVELSDFGLSRQSDLFSSHAGHIPIKWSAPEAIEFGIFSQQSDVWSFGVLIWEMYSLGDLPYEAVEPKLMLESLKRGYRLDPPAETPDALRLLMISCWENRVSNRPSLATIVATLHAYVHGDSANCGL